MGYQTLFSSIPVSWPRNFATALLIVPVFPVEARSASKSPALRLAVRGSGRGYVADDALDQDDMDVYVTGHIGQGLGDEVVDGRGTQAGGLTLGACGAGVT
jgi:hypothetical protein